jgi:hypothetical protein
VAKWKNKINATKKIVPIEIVSVPRASSPHPRELGIHETGKITLYQQQGGVGYFGISSRFGGNVR